MRNKVLFFLLLNLLWGTAYAEDISLANGELPLTSNRKFSAVVKDDSLAIYHALITEENLNADYRPNVTGIVFGSVYVGLGTGFLGGGIGVLNASFANKSVHRVLGTTFIVVAIPFYLVGLPILISNIYEYSVRKGHANRRDEYIDALKRYKERQRESSVEWMLVPSVDLANAGGGLNLLVAF